MIKIGAKLKKATIRCKYHSQCAAARNGERNFSRPVGANFDLKLKSLNVTLAEISG